ncbi:MAG: hypothetical protein RIF33_13370 [Cyclobacteriaceae bacterium]
MQLPWYQNSTLWLWAIYALIVGTIVLRVNVEATNYTTPDSEYYMRAADNVVEGKGFVVAYMVYPFDDATPEKDLIIWPIGYPALISLPMYVLDLDALGSSKLINFLSLGLIFLLLQRMFGSYAWLPALYFFSYGRMEVFSYSWSEAPFLFAELLLCWITIKSLSDALDKTLWLKLTLGLISLFLLRYAGLIFFFFSAGMMVYFAYRKEYKKSTHYFMALTIASVFVLAYFYRNYLLSGYYAGMDRVQPDAERIGYFIWLLIRGLFNELMLARNYFFKGNLDLLFTGLFVIQVGLIFWLVKWRKLINRPTLLSRSSTILLACSATYLIGIVILRKIQPFDPFDFRILAPFSTPLFIALFSSLGLPENRAYYHKTVPWIVAFMGLCWVMNLPKQYLLELVLK